MLSRKLRLDENVECKHVVSMTDATNGFGGNQLKIVFDDTSILSIIDGKGSYTHGAEVEVAYFDVKGDYDRQMIQAENDDVKGGLSYPDAIRLIEKIDREIERGVIK